jgi:hypothetical protein
MKKHQAIDPFKVEEENIIDEARTIIIKNMDIQSTNRKIFFPREITFLTMETRQ